jgi:hypothetical protein
VVVKAGCRPARLMTRGCHRTWLSAWTSLPKPLTHIATDTGEGTQSMRDMLVSLNKMNTTMAVIAVPMYQIRNDMGHMSNNMQHVAGPMKMVPW